MAEPRIRAFVDPVAVGDTPIDMPPFLERRRHVPEPIESTYGKAYESVPRRWRAILDRA